RKRSALDRLLPRLSAEGRRTIDIRRNALGLAAQKLRLAPLQNAVSTARLNLDRQADDLARNIARQADRNRQRLDRSERLLSTLGYRNVLARGYAVIRDENTHVVRDLAKLPAGSRVEVETHKIKRSAVLEGPSAAKPAPKPKRKAQPAAASQGDLF
ncbi:MAG: exodeoxyribonuclease VII large subunit, partial [Pseudomonadota bacterium]